ncbi:hypothetical protein [Leclercia sp. G3L]|nr:hypothetical protein [Leclercia sp. G3L]
MTKMIGLGLLFASIIAFAVDEALKEDVEKALILTRHLRTAFVS